MWDRRPQEAAWLSGGYSKTTGLLAASSGVPALCLGEGGWHYCLWTPSHPSPALQLSPTL